MTAIPFAYIWFKQFLDFYFSALSLSHSVGWVGCYHLISHTAFFSFVAILPQIDTQMHSLTQYVIIPRLPCSSSNSSILYTFSLLKKRSNDNGFESIQFTLCYPLRYDIYAFKFSQCQKDYHLSPPLPLIDPIHF